LALAARVRGHAAFAVLARAVEALGQDARERRFAHAARAGEKVGVMQTIFIERML
jgi:hypothetical protein